MKTDDNTDKSTDQVEINGNIPSPPPLPVQGGTNCLNTTMNNTQCIVKLENATTLLSVPKQVQNLWAKREVITAGDDVPSKFALFDLEPIIQESRNCGLVALAMASTATPIKLKQKELLLEAFNRGYTKQGEMFSAENMASLAYSVVHPWFIVELLKGGLSANEDYILNGLAKGALALVPYDADYNNNPCCRKGHRAHWAVICGLAKIKCGDPKVYLYARQGKSRYLSMWSFERLSLSNNNLKEFDPNRAKDSFEYVLPEGGVEAGLAGKVVLLHLLHRGPDFTHFNDM